MRNPMRILVIGAGELGARTVKQLRKNERIEIVVSDHREDPYALREGIIDKVDIKLHVTPMNAVQVCLTAKPALVLIARKLKDWGHHNTLMGSQYVAGMERELAKLHIPVIPVSGDVEF